MQLNAAMIIDSENYKTGNKALASVLLLYYHLIQEGGFTNDQTVCIDPDDFNGFNFLDVKVNGDLNLEIEEKLLREGAVIYLLCELNDMIQNYENDYLKQKTTKKIIAAQNQGKFSSIPETEKLFETLKWSEKKFDYETYNKHMSEIYKNYVVRRFRKMVE